MFPLINSSVHSINTSNKHYLRRPNAKISRFQKSTFYSGIKIFYTLPNNLTSLKNEKSKFKVALRIYYEKGVFFFFSSPPHTCTVHLDIIKVSFIHQLMHWWVILKNSIKIYIKTAPTCFGVTVTPSSGNILIRAPWWWCNCNTRTLRSCFNVDFNVNFNTVF